MKQFLGVVVFLLGALSSIISHGATWYVSKTGNDSNPGTLALPKLTINGAIDVMGGGDTVIIGAGIYDELLTNASSGALSSFTNPIPNGNSSQRTKFQSAPGADVWLRPVSHTYPGGGGAITMSSTSQYVEFDGLNIDGLNTHSSGINIVGAHHVVRNAEIINAYSLGLASQSGDDILFSNLHIHDNGQTWTPPQNDPDAPLPHGCYICGTNKTIEYSEVNNHRNYGIQISCEQGGIQNSTVNGNYVHDNASRGIQVQGTNALITNNLVVDNGIGIGTANSGAKILNNTIHGWTNTVSDSYGIIVGGNSTEVKNNIITAQDDNIFSGGKSRYIYWLAGTPTFGGNVCDLTRTGCGIVDSVDDIMVNAAGGDLHLATGSPAIGYGVMTTPSITTDFDGVTRITNDSGAFAYIPGVPGDYNDDGIVDAADYVVWRKGGPLMNEGTSMGLVDDADFNFWRARYGNPAAGAGGANNDSPAVPEPTAWVLVAILLAALGNCASPRSAKRAHIADLVSHR